MMMVAGWGRSNVFCRPLFSFYTKLQIQQLLDLRPVIPPNYSPAIPCTQHYSIRPDLSSFHLSPPLTHSAFRLVYSLIREFSKSLTLFGLLILLFLSRVGEHAINRQCRTDMDHKRPPKGHTPLSRTICGRIHWRPPPPPPPKSYVYATFVLLKHNFRNNVRMFEIIFIHLTE